MSVCRGTHRTHQTLRKGKIYFLVACIFATSASLFSQEAPIFVEAPIYTQDNVLYSTQVTLNFKHQILDLAPGVVETEIKDISSSYPALKSAFAQLENQYGKFLFEKQVPHAQWGDVWRPHRVTGKPVQIHEWSQLFILKFENFVPVDSILNIITGFPEIEYAHAPFVAIADVNPNDPDYDPNPNLQWYLFQIGADKTWDINKGDPSRRIGIVEIDGHPDGTHPDFWTGQGGQSGTNKFDVIPGGTGGNHATRVGGLVGAATNDNEGIASLGWDLIMNAYEVTVNNSLVNAMNQAINDGCDVINCSFTLYTSNKEFDTQCGCDIRDPLRQGENASLDAVFEDAIQLGIVVVGTMANSGFNRIDNPEKPGCNPNICVDLVPFTPFPGAYDNVICVTATDISDDVPNNYNFGGFIDLSAPGINIYSTSPGGGHNIENGSSFSAPLVSALAGLILSTNPTLTRQQVEDLLDQTVDVINESASKGGAGRINAHAAVLKALDDLPDRTSNSDLATAHNSGRRLVRDSSGNYHLVYQAGNQVFYAKYSATGSWSADVRISDGLGQYGYPSIAASSSNLFVTWQKKSGTTASPNHDIYFHKSTDGGSTWPVSNQQVISSNVGSSDPLPVITRPSTSDLVVVYRSGTKLNSRHSSNNGSSWYTESIGQVGQTFSSPSIALVKDVPWGSADTPAIVYQRSDGDVYYRYYGGASGWTGQNALSSIVPGTSQTHQTPSISGQGAGSTILHVAWHETSGSGAFQNTIIYRKSSAHNSWPSSYTRIYYQEQQRPTISALASNKVHIVYQQKNYEKIYRQSFTGSYWGGPVYVADGQHPSVSSGNTSAKFAWTSASGPPYTVELSPTTLSKASPGELYYERAISWLDSSGVHLTVQVNDVSLRTKTGGKKA